MPRKYTEPTNLLNKQGLSNSFRILEVLKMIYQYYVEKWRRKEMFTPELSGSRRKKVVGIRIVLKDWIRDIDFDLIIPSFRPIDEDCDCSTCQNYTRYRKQKFYQTNSQYFFLSMSEVNFFLQFSGYGPDDAEQASPWSQHEPELPEAEVRHQHLFRTQPFRRSRLLRHQRVPRQKSRHIFS